MENLTKKDVHLMGSAVMYKELESLIKEKMYWASVKCEPSERYTARWGNVYDVYNRNGRVDTMVIIEPTSSKSRRWGIYTICKEK